MAHVMKATRGSVGGLTKHYERAKDDEGRHYRFKNIDIDHERTRLNYNLAPHRSEGQIKFTRRTAEKYQALKRDDVNVMATWVITRPKEIRDDEAHPFFVAAYEFLCDRYGFKGEIAHPRLLFEGGLLGGEDNVISAYVHRDETTDHMHFAFVPLHHDKEKGTVKVNAKKALDKKDLRTFHEDLSRHMARVFGRDVGILNGATMGFDKVEQLKKYDAEYRAIASASREAGEELQKAVNSRKSILDEVQSLKDEKNRLEGEIKALAGICEETRRDIERTDASFAGIRRSIMHLNQFIALPDIGAAYSEFFDISGGVGANPEQIRKSYEWLRGSGVSLLDRAREKLEAADKITAGYAPAPVHDAPAARARTREKDYGRGR
jgi:hypothetical protein